MEPEGLPGTAEFNAPQPEASTDTSVETVYRKVRALGFLGIHQDADLRQIIPAAREREDSAAQETLAMITLTLAERAASKWQPSTLDVGVIAGTAYDKIINNRLFDPNWQPPPLDVCEEDVPKYILHKFHTFVRRTVRSVAVDALTVQTRERLAVAGRLKLSERPYYDNPDVTASLPYEQLKEILSPRQLRVVQYIGQGKTTKEIAEILDAGIWAIKQVMVRARRAIEDHILSPAGLKRTTTFPNSSTLARQLRLGKIKGVRVVGFYYVKDEWLSTTAPPSGYVRLREVATEADSQAFRRRFPDRIQPGDYISPQDLELLKEIKPAMVGSEERWANADFVPIALATNSGIESKATAKLARKYKDDPAVVQRHGRIYLVRRDFLDNLVAQVRERQARSRANPSFK